MPIGSKDQDFAGRFLGVVRVDVGGKSFTLAVQALHFGRDGDLGSPGGFFADNTGRLGIFVDASASDEEVQGQIERGCVEAVRHLSRRLLN